MENVITELVEVEKTARLKKAHSSLCSSKVNLHKPTKKQ